MDTNHARHSLTISCYFLRCRDLARGQLSGKEALAIKPASQDEGLDGGTEKAEKGLD